MRPTAHHIASVLRAAADRLLVHAAKTKETTGFAAALKDALPKYEAGTGGENETGETDLSKVEIKPVAEVLQRVALAFKPAGLGATNDYSQVPWLAALNPAQQKKLYRTFTEAHDLLAVLEEERKKGPDGKYALGGHQRNVTRLRGFLPHLAAIDKLAAKHEEREAHGPFTLVALPGVTKAEYGGALDALDAATDHLKSKFPQVLYGDVYLKTAIRHSGKGAAGAYDYDRDHVQLNVNAKHRVNDVYSLIHEFGHRYDNKFLDSSVRDEVDKLSKQGIAVTDYGGTDPRENFAEGFAHFVLNMSLPPELKAIFERLS